VIEHRHVRRCAVLMIEPRERLRLDVGSLLSGNDALVWGKIKESYTDATEYPGSTVEYGTAFNQAYLGWRLEREHLEKLLKTWIGAKMDERRAQITGQHLDMMQNMLESFARALGFDPHNPDVRRKAVAAITST